MKKNLIVLLAFAVLGILFPQAVSHRAEAQVRQSATFLSAIDHFVMGRTDMAKKGLRDLVRLNPTHAPSYFYLSKIAYSERDIESSAALAKRALEIDPGNADYLELYFYVLLEVAPSEELLDVLTQLAELRPKREDYRLYSASVLAQMGRFEDAIRVCDKFLVDFGTSPQVVDLMRNINLTAQNYAGALSVMQRAVSADPDNIQYRMDYGELAHGLGENATAEIQFFEALRIDPNFQQAQLALLELYEAVGDITAYIRALEPYYHNPEVPAAQKVESFENYFFTPAPYRNNYNEIRALMTTLVLTHPRDIQVRLLYGRFLTYTGAIDEAEEHYKTLVGETSPPDSIALTRLSELYSYKEDFSQAIHFAALGSQIYGGFAFRAAEIFALWNSDDKAGAYRLADKSLREFKSDSLRSELMGFKGDLYHQDGKISQSYSAYRKALRYNPDNALVLNNYAYFLSEEGKNLKEALKMSVRANELVPQNDTYLDTQAWVLYKLGRYAEAKVLMEQVMEINPEQSPEVLMHFGDILYALGEDAPARGYWQNAKSSYVEAEDGMLEEIEQRLALPQATPPSTDN